TGRGRRSGYGAGGPADDAPRDGHVRASLTRADPARLVETDDRARGGLAARGPLPCARLQRGSVTAPASANTPDDADRRGIGEAPVTDHHRRLAVRHGR